MAAKYTDEELRRAVDLHNDGLTWKQVAQIIGRTDPGRLAEKCKIERAAALRDLGKRTIQVITHLNPEEESLFATYCRTHRMTRSYALRLALNKLLTPYSEDRT